MDYDKRLLHFHPNAMPKNNKNKPMTHTPNQNTLAKELFLKTALSIHIMVTRSVNQDAF
jgi:hypothetical protein